MKKFLWRLGVYQKMLAKFVSWLRGLLSLNRLKSPEILNRVVLGNADSQGKSIFV